MKRNTLTTAVVAGLTGMAGMVSVSNAVNVNPDGMGQVLLYPYYSARGGNDTLISIVNTTERGKAVKIRFIEALNSREVLDFNIYMSPYDVWTAVVTAEGEGGKVITSDTTCTVPYFYNATAGFGEQAFLDFEYAPTAARDGGPTGIERTASGYIEVIEMGTLLATPEKKPKATEATYVAWAVKHAAGVPGDCQALVNAWTDYQGATTTDTLGGGWVAAPTFGFDTDQGVSGGIYGAASIINVADGTMFSYNATAIDGFFDAGDMSHTDPGNLLPSLASGTGDTSYVFSGGAVLTHTWSETFEAVNAVITHDKIMNEYVTDAEIGARTEWVVTMPTKRLHTDGLSTALPPFTRGWYESGTGANKKWNFACEDLTFSFYDREERPDPVTPATPGPKPPVVSPQPPPGETVTPTPDLFQLCREANVIRFASDDSVPAASEILKEPVRTGTVFGYVNFELPYTEGWVAIDLANVDEDSTVFATTPIRQNQAENGDFLNGLPVIGFGVTTYTNGNIGAGVLANYGGTFAHRATRAISS